jgi:hypothetical protein
MEGKPKRGTKKTCAAEKLFASVKYSPCPPKKKEQKMTRGNALSFRSSLNNGQLFFNIN